MRLGANVELFLLDERQYRDDQPCDDDFFVPCADAEDEPRRYLGDRQMDWLKRRLRASGGTWKLVGNQLMIMSLDTAPGAPINKDSWDGYGRERRELLEHVRASGIQRRELPDRRHPHLLRRRRGHRRPRARRAWRRSSSAARSPRSGCRRRCESASGAPLSKEQFLLVSNNLPLTNPHLKYQEQSSRGYGVLEASRSELKVTYKAVDALRHTSSTRTIGRFRVARGNPHVQVL